jgi:hypothetical protein
LHGLITSHCNIRKKICTPWTSLRKTVCRLRSEEEETIFHIVFECKALACRRFNLLGLINLGEGIPKRNLVNRLLDLKGTNLFTQEQMNVEK